MHRGVQPISCVSRALLHAMVYSLNVCQHADTMTELMLLQPDLQLQSVQTAVGMNGLVTYSLDIPAHCNIHTNLHVSMLRHAHDNGSGVVRINAA